MPRPKGSKNKKNIKKSNNIIKVKPETRICICCTKDKKEIDYYMSKSPTFKGFQRLPICKECIDILFEDLLKRTSFDVEKSIYYLCMKLDYPFAYSVIDAAKKQTEKTGTSIHRIYIQKINSFGEVNNYGEVFMDGEQMKILTAKTNDDNNHENFGDNSLEQFEIDEDLKIFWGYGFNPKDYIFLEKELSDWKTTHKCDNQAEITLLKEICIKILEIRKKREDKDPIGKEQKELQDLMKTASLDPAKANIAGAGKSLDAFGLWIKDLEQLKPAEWHDQQEKYKDMDGFVSYIKNYILRPIKNFITGNRDFQIDEDIIVNLDDNIDSGEEYDKS